MKLGERVHLVPLTFGHGIDKPGNGSGHTKNDLKREVKPQNGTITYIHPSMRWYQVTFDIGVKECFFV